MRSIEYNIYAIFHLFIIIIIIIIIIIQFPPLNIAPTYYNTI